MATTKEYIEFVCEQVRGYEVRYRKMFGEYMVYAYDKPILLVCDDTVYVKIVPELEDVMTEAEKGYPYEGASLHYVLDIEDQTLVSEVVAILVKVIPIPKKRKK